MMSTPATALARAISTPISRQVSVSAAVRPTVGVFCSAQRGYVTSGKVAENKLSSKVPSTVEKKPAQETMTQIKSALVSLVSEEIGARKEGGEEASSLWEVSQKWAQETGFTVTENAEGITTMTKKAGPHTVTVTFDPNEQGEPEEGEDNDENENQDDEEETDENGDRQMIESGESTKELHFEVKVTFGERGSLNLYAFTPEDGRLYVDHLSVSDGLAQDAKVREFDWYNMGDDTQDKLYDFFDKLGVDDQLAKYIKLSAVQAESNREVEFLNTFKSLLLSK